MSRLVALAVDLTLVATACVSVASLPALALAQITSPVPSWFKDTMALVAALLPWLYFAIAWWVTGRTAGGLLLGIMVQRPDGGRLHVVQAALRSAIGLLLWPIWLAGLFTILSDHRRRALHDRLFHTVVRHVR